MSEVVEVYRDRGSTVVVQKSPRSRRRLNDLEDRVFQQEKTTQALVERAYELKDHITSDKFKPSTMDAALQQLWHEHIRTITSTVKKLSRDIESIKYEVAARDVQTQDATLQTRNVEQLAHAGVSDLRGRVVRCDTSIARLAQDVRVVSSSAQLETDRIRQTAEANKSKTEQMEKEMNDMTRRMDKLLSEQEGKLQSMRGNSSKQMEDIDSRLKRIIEDIRMNIESNKRWAETERMRIEQQLMQIVEMNANAAHTRQETFENKVMERIDSLQRSVEECRAEYKKCKEELKEKADKAETSQRMDRLTLHMESEFARLKSEYRDGFESVKESIDTTNKLVNGKIKLVKDEVTRDLNNVKKMIVLI
uniref:Protein FAM81A n=1 Tax=Phallusia mammillata TaxID=59560 RepID=A0A6F9DBW6_9ASCI|nr:protein FAM81A [Phallusia mammillata]